MAPCETTEIKNLSEEGGKRGEADGVLLSTNGTARGSGDNSSYFISFVRGIRNFSVREAYFVVRRTSWKGVRAYETW